MRGRQAFTLMEMIVVMIIIGVVVSFAFPAFVGLPMQHAKATTAVNNLLAIYSAEQNYYNNNGSYCFDTANPNLCNSLADINTDLSMNILDDGSYTYYCDTGAGSPPVYACHALNASYSANAITVFLNGTSGAIKAPFFNNVNPYSGDCPGTKCPF